MRKFFALLLACMMLLTWAMPAAAANGEVVYSKSARKFFFYPGTNYSPTDLFPEFKDVMPGDSIQQKILVKNDVSNKCKIKIYMRSLGAHEDSKQFLSQLNLKVVKATDTIMFDAPADQTSKLKDWVYLGTLYSGGQCELNLTLDVPVTLDNNFKNLVGYIDWEFAVEELPVESTDPQPPKTGDDSRIFLWATVMAGSAIILIFFLFGRKKKEKK